MNLKQIVAPAALAVSLDEAKEHLRVDHDAENDLITALIQAATAWLDGWSGVLCIALEAQTLELTLDAFPSGCIRLPIGPTTAISSVKYLSADGEQTLSTGNGQHHHARQHEARAVHEQRRHGRHGHTQGVVGGAPDEVDDEQGHHQGQQAAVLGGDLEIGRHLAFLTG